MREKYESLSLATLKDLAKARGLKGISTLRKPELIERMLQEDEKESTGGEAEMKKTEILQEEPGRQENRVRENRTSYEANERKTYQDKNYQDRNYTERTEYAHKNPTDTAQLDSGEKANGILEVLPDGYGFIRCANYLPGENDIYVSPSQIRRFNLKTGDILKGSIRIKTQGEKFSALLYVDSINGFPPSEGQRRYNFEDMTPIFPNERLRMERPGGTVAMRIMDLLSPIGKGQRGMIVSPPKAGKTTLLKLIGGLLTPDKGEVFIDGERLNTANLESLYRIRRKMGMLFQFGALFTDMTVFNNVAFPLREHTDLPEALIRDLVLLKLNAVGLRGAAQLYPSEISGGMSRRVALARTVALDPMLIMYDEPFAGLDPISMGVTAQLIRNLNTVLGSTSLIVTHDVQETFGIADYVYMISSGKVAAHGTPDELRQSKDPFVYQFVNGLPDGPVRFQYPAEPLNQELGLK